MCELRSKNDNNMRPEGKIIDRKKLKQKTYEHGTWALAIDTTPTLQVIVPKSNTEYN